LQASVITELTVTQRIRELLHVANMVFALAESKTAGNEDFLHFLRVGERALISVGDLLSAMSSDSLALQVEPAERRSTQIANSRLKTG
jgi:hypothetical protein